MDPPKFSSACFLDSADPRAPNCPSLHALQPHTARRPPSCLRYPPCLRLSHAHLVARGKVGFLACTALSDRMNGICLHATFRSRRITCNFLRHPAGALQQRVYRQSSRYTET
jgi:hypothetical protein